MNKGYFGVEVFMLCFVVLQYFSSFFEGFCVVSEVCFVCCGVGYGSGCLFVFFSYLLYNMVFYVLVVFCVLIMDGIL